jgi:hypothetical protein
MAPPVPPGFVIVLGTMRTSASSRHMVGNNDKETCVVEAKESSESQS